MSRRAPSLVSVGETEMEVLRHVWAIGEETGGDANASAVLDRILLDRPLAYTTVMTVLKNLETKALITRRRIGRVDHYRAAQAPEAVRQGLLRGFLGHVFDGSPTALVRTLVGDERITDEERDELRRLLDRI